MARCWVPPWRMPGGRCGGRRLSYTPRALRRRKWWGPYLQYRAFQRRLLRLRGQPEHDPAFTRDMLALLRSRVLLLLREMREGCPRCQTGPRPQQGTAECEGCEECEGCDTRFDCTRCGLTASSKELIRFEITGAGYARIRDNNNCLMNDRYAYRDAWFAFKEVMGHVLDQPKRLLQYLPRRLSSGLTFYEGGRLTPQGQRAPKCGAWVDD
eukprot:TRINITY_DN24184_c0_g1_i1.p1 TRINITY_DN24184_c0_g1~~TRINITY_DN24184_c0_g1_i1.p1  ORF type:complete len:211 (+),score=14.64 TRINITY_DN24184_c0_g1_i1:166-798(+)